MRFELRDYRVKPGEMDEWIAEWSEKVRPLRAAFGFESVGAWVARTEDRFIWILGHDDFEAADQRYYESERRRSIQPDPVRHLAHTEHVLMDPVDRP